MIIADNREEIKIELNWGNYRTSESFQHLVVIGYEEDCKKYKSKMLGRKRYKYII